MPPGNEAFARKLDVNPALKPITKRTFRGDADAILEALIGETSEQHILAALAHQGFAPHAYLSTLRALAPVAVERPSQRHAA